MKLPIQNLLKNRAWIWYMYRMTHVSGVFRLWKKHVPSCENTTVLRIYLWIHLRQKGPEICLAWIIMYAITSPRTELATVAVKIIAKCHVTVAVCFAISYKCHVTNGSICYLQDQCHGTVKNICKIANFFKKILYTMLARDQWNPCSRWIIFSFSEFDHVFFCVRHKCQQVGNRNQAKPVNSRARYWQKKFQVLTLLTYHCSWKFYNLISLNTKVS